ncbi:DYW_deaminase domain-containing protein [Psidium guajava]|nr:DYW_deaminase domain-containing protein [Psidium guajava]
MKHGRRVSTRRPTLHLLRLLFVATVAAVGKLNGNNCYFPCLTVMRWRTDLNQNSFSSLVTGHHLPQ